MIIATASAATDALVPLANILRHLLCCLDPLRYAVPLSARPAYSNVSGRPDGSSHRSFMATLLSRIAHMGPPRTSSSEELLTGVRVPIVPALAGFAACTMAPIVSKPVRWSFPLGEVRVVYEAVYLSEAAVGPTRPIRLAVLIGFRKGRGSVDRQYLRATGRTVEHSIRQAPHLGVAALAGVAPWSVWQGGYTPEGLQHRPAYVSAARFTAHRV